MRIFEFLLVMLISVFMTSSVFAAYQRMPMNIKTPGQYFLEKQTITDPAVAAAGDTLNDAPGVATSATSSTATSSMLIAQPDVPRVYSVTTGGTTADVAAGYVTIYGTDITGATISDALAITENQNGTTTGVKAFKTITSITFPAEDSPYGATWDVQRTDALGMDNCLDDAGNLAWATFGGTFETTRPTVTVHSTVVSRNVANPNATLDGTASLILYYIPNYRCK